MNVAGEAELWEVVRASGRIRAGSYQALITMVVVRRIKAMIMGSADIDYLIVHLLTEVTTSICHFKIKLI